MKKSRRLIPLLAGLSVIAQDTTIRSTTQEVVVDFIARDKHGKQVRDLKPGEIKVLESGSAQNVRSFRMVESGSAAEQAGASAAPATAAIAGGPLGRVADPTADRRLVTIVFERLSASGRRLAREGAISLLKQDQDPNAYYGVFYIDQGLRPLMRYSNDRDRVSAFITKATSQAGSLFKPEPGAVEAVANAKIDTSGLPANGATGQQNSSAGSSFSELAQQRMVQEMVGLNDDLARQQQSQASLYSLLALVKGQEKFAGRKAILYFTEGLAMSNSTRNAFQATVGAANRANVTVYAIDVRGLPIESQLTEGRDAMLGAAQQSAAGLRNNSALSRADFMVTDAALDSLQANVQANMEDLAVSTGGSLIANTNDLRPAMKRINDDLRTHYEVSYVPSAAEYDGKFRPLQIQVSRPNVTVQARTGYFAFPPEMNSVLFPYEVALLQSLSAAQPRRDFAFRAGGFQFRHADNQTECAIEVEVPLKELTVQKDAVKKKYAARVSVLMLIQDGQGRAVRKISRDVPFDGALEKLAGFQAGNFIYTDHFALPPGRYTLASVAADRLSTRLSVKKTVFYVPPATGSLQLSTPAFIRRVESGGTSDDPFVFTGGKVTPTLGTALPAGSSLSLYFVVYADRQGPAPEVVMEFASEGKTLAHLKQPLPAPDAEGRIPYVATSDVSKLGKGTYDLRILARQGEQTAAQHTQFTIE